MISREYVLGILHPLDLVCLSQYFFLIFFFAFWVLTSINIQFFDFGFCITYSIVSSLFELEKEFSSDCLSCQPNLPSISSSILLPLSVPSGCSITCWRDILSSEHYLALERRFPNLLHRRTGNFL